MIHTVLQVAGLAVIAAGLFMLMPWLGVVAAGVSLVLLGVSVEADRRRNAGKAV